MNQNWALFSQKATKNVKKCKKQLKKPKNGSKIGQLLHLINYEYNNCINIALNRIKFINYAVFLIKKPVILYIIRYNSGQIGANMCTLKLRYS